MGYFPVDERWNSGAPSAVMARMLCVNCIRLSTAEYRDNVKRHEMLRYTMAGPSGRLGARQARHGAEGEQTK
jgi:hypothetical protein